MYNFTVGARYTFDTVAPAILGATIKNAKLQAIVNFDFANTISNMTLEHHRMRAYMPAGSAFDDPSQFAYLIIMTETGSRMAIAYPWIKESTISKITATAAIITIIGVGSSDVVKIRNLLALAGYNNITSKLTSSDA